MYAINHPKLKPDALIIGGDITGKDLVYIVKKENNTFLSTERGQTIKLLSLDAAKAHEKKVSDGGSYVFWCELDEYNNISSEKSKQDELLKNLIEKRIEEWLEIADRKLKGVDIPLIMNTGNDDFYSIDELIKNSNKVVFPEGKIVQLGHNLSLISCGYANLTPFNCPRDISEENLFTKIDTYLQDYLNKGLDIRQCILNLHCPPINTKLDEGPKLVDGNQPQLTAFGKETDAVGSTAVRKIIEKYQPLLALHGHIHESPNIDNIGTTRILNPGSEYQSGILRFAVIDFDEDQLKQCFLRTAM